MRTRRTLVVDSVARPRGLVVSASKLPVDGLVGLGLKTNKAGFTGFGLKTWKMLSRGEGQHVAASWSLRRVEASGAAARWSTLKRKP